MRVGRAAGAAGPGLGVPGSHAEPAPGKWHWASAEGGGRGAAVGGQDPLGAGAVLGATPEGRRAMDGGEGEPKSQPGSAGGGSPVLPHGSERGGELAGQWVWEAGESLLLQLLSPPRGRRRRCRGQSRGSLGRPPRPLSSPLNAKPCTRGHGGGRSPLSPTSSAEGPEDGPRAQTAWVTWGQPRWGTRGPPAAVGGRRGANRGQQLSLESGRSAGFSEGSIWTERGGGFGAVQPARGS